MMRVWLRLVFGDDNAARGTAVDLRMRGLARPPRRRVANSAAAEAMSSVLIFLNKTYQADGAGIRITGEFVPPAN